MVLPAIMRNVINAASKLTRVTMEFLSPRNQPWCLPCDLSKAWSKLLLEARSQVALGPFTLAGDLVSTSFYDNQFIRAVTY